MVSEVEKDEDGNPRPLKITFKSRTSLNKCFYVAYRAFRALYISFMFYFLPFFAIIVSTIFPQYFKTVNPQCALLSARPHFQLPGVAYFL